MKNINSIIVDLDRTLLRTDKSLSDYTVDILKRCKGTGMNVILASARPLRNVVYYDSIVNFDALVVSNGGRIIYKDSIVNNLIPKESVKRFLSLLEKYPYFQIVFETGDEAYSNIDVDYFDTVVSDNLVEVINSNDILKIVIKIHDENSIDIIKDYLDDSVYYSIANNSVIQIMSKDATKWNGVSEVLKLCNIDESTCIYFGDDNDDVKPISMCGIGVAMGNSIEECKKVSDYVCKTNDEDGVCKFIDEFLLKER